MQLRLTNIMQPTQSNLINYLASKRSGSGDGITGNGSLHTGNSAMNMSNSGRIASMVNGQMHEIQHKVTRASHETDPNLLLLSHPGTNPIHNMRRDDLTSGAMSSLSTGFGTSDEELKVAHQRTAALLNQYFHRQDQVDTREKLLLEQRLSSALGTSSYSKSLLLQLQKEQQAQQLLQFHSSLSNNRMPDSLILELLNQSNQGRQGSLSIQELQGLQQPFLLPAVHQVESAAVTQLQQKILQLQQIEAQNKLQTHLMNLTGSSGAHGDLNAINSMQYDSSPLLSNFDTMTRARFFPGVRDIRQSSVASISAEQMLIQNVAGIFTSNSSSGPMQAWDESIAANMNDKKPSAAANVLANANCNKKVIHRMGRVGKFPLKLHALLNDLKAQGRSDIAAFLPHGLAFSILNTEEFVKTIMPLHFRMSRYSSFQRQLNLYDFQRITEGPDKGAYHHPLFLEGQPDLLCGMKRNKIKGIAGKQQAKRSDHVATTSKVPSAVQSGSGEADCEDDEESDDESEKI